MPEQVLEISARGLRLALRAPVLMLHVAIGLLLAALVNLDPTRRLRPEALARWWHRRLLEILGIDLVVHGEPLQSGHMMVANHVSWLDIPVICACIGTRFVSKSEVRRWPLAGWLADAAGTFYLRRGKGGVKPLLMKLVPHLHDGGSVVIYPEGTTSDGAGVLPFHARLFAAAIEAEVPVQPVALSYRAGDAGAQLAPFIGDDDLLSHLLRLLKNSAITVDLSFCEPLSSRGVQRDALARTCRERILARIETVEPHAAGEQQPLLAQVSGGAVGACAPPTKSIAAGAIGPLTRCVIAEATPA